MSNSLEDHKNDAKLSSLCIGKTIKYIEYEDELLRIDFEDGSFVEIISYGPLDLSTNTVKQ